MDVLFECDPMPRCGFYDYAVRIAEPKRPILQPNYAGDMEKPRRVVPAAVRGTARRIREKMERAMVAQGKAVVRRDEVRSAYWYRVFMRWARKQSKLNNVWPEILDR